MPRLGESLRKARGAEARGDGRLVRAKCSRTWVLNRVADLAGAPEVTEHHLRKLEQADGAVDGARLRAVLAVLPAANINFFEAMAAAGSGYWPPMRPISDAEFHRMCSDLGIKVRRQHNRQVLIELPGNERQ